MDTNKQQRMTLLYIEIGRIIRSVATCNNPDCEACINALAIKDQYNNELNELRASA